MEKHCVRAVANEYTVITKSPNPGEAFCYTPGIVRMTNGNLLVTMDYGGRDLRKIFPNSPVFDKKPPMHYITQTSLGCAYVSEDNGETWSLAHEFPLTHARPFVIGNKVYIIGHYCDIGILMSEDSGKTFSPVSDLTTDQMWHQSACNVLVEDKYVYLVMERLAYDDQPVWPIASLAPVLMRARVDDDLLKKESWTFASEMVFRDVVRENELEFFGLPSYKDIAPMGWLETNVVRIRQPGHLWHDPEGKTLHLIMRMHTGLTGYGAVVKVKENDDGTMSTDFVTMPTGKKLLFLPIPGGQMKFFIEYDEKTNLYWLLGSQTTNSMVNKEGLLPGQMGPDNQRNRLILSFSRNLVDWQFACLVAEGEKEVCSRHYASMIIDGEDILVASRSGDIHAKSAHDGNMITFHRVKNFREYVW